MNNVRIRIIVEDEELGFFIKQLTDEFEISEYEVSHYVGSLFYLSVCKETDYYIRIAKLVDDYFLSFGKNMMLRYYYPISERRLFSIFCSIYSLFVKLRKENKYSLPYNTNMVFDYRAKNNIFIFEYEYYRSKNEN